MPLESNRNSLLMEETMNLLALFPCKRPFCALALACAFVFTFHLAAQRTPAQKSGKQKTTESKKSEPVTSSSALTASENDYAAKVKEYTTEKYFLTELVDHLPMSD